MKINQIILALALVTSFASLSTLAHAETTKVTVNGMVCAFCAQGIEAALKALPETQFVYVDLKQKIVAVEPKLGKTLPQAKVKKEIEDAGYDAVKFELTAQTVAQIKAELNAKGK